MMSLNLLLAPPILFFGVEGIRQILKLLGELSQLRGNRIGKVLRFARFLLLIFRIISLLHGFLMAIFRCAFVGLFFGFMSPDPFVSVEVFRFVDAVL